MFIKLFDKCKAAIFVTLTPLNAIPERINENTHKS